MGVEREKVEDGYRAAHKSERDQIKEGFRAARKAGRFEKVPGDGTDKPRFRLADFHNELQAALKGRLDGANTIARVNDALRDIFESFVLAPASQKFVGVARRTDENGETKIASRLSRYQLSGEGIQVTPILRTDSYLEIVEQATELGSLVTDDEELRPPLRTITAPAALSGAGSLSASGQVHPEGKSPTRSRSGH